MTDLAAQILAALDRAEEIARAATPGPWRVGIGAHVESGPDTFEGDEEPSVCDTWGQYDDAAHIAANDPAHVLRLCAALREVVELHALSTEDVCDVDGIERPGRDCVECWDTYPCRTLHMLASVWDVPGVAE